MFNELKTSQQKCIIKTLLFGQITHSLLSEILALWPPGGPWPLVWELVASSSRISQASCPERPWALGRWHQAWPQGGYYQGHWGDLDSTWCVCVCVYVCVCCSFSWTTVEPVQICAAVFFVCVCACLYGQFFPGVNCWSSTNGRCWGVGPRAVVCSWNICLCFSWVKLWSGAGRRRGQATEGEEMEEELEESV